MYEDIANDGTPTSSCPDWRSAVSSTATVAEELQNRWLQQMCIGIKVCPVSILTGEWCLCVSVWYAVTCLYDSLATMWCHIEGRFGITSHRVGFIDNLEPHLCCLVMSSWHNPWHINRTLFTGGSRIGLKAYRSYASIGIGGSIGYIHWYVLYVAIVKAPGCVHPYCISKLHLSSSIVRNKQINKLM